VRRGRHVGAFEGAYGALYDRWISSDLLRSAVLAGGGGLTPLLDLDRLAARVAAAVPRDGTVLDVPSGGAPLLPRLARAGFAGRVVAVDLAEAMLERARARAARVPGIALEAVRADAQALPLADASVDAAVSLNGVHCLPDPRAFVAELGRVVRPGGAALLVTLVAGDAWRTGPVIAAGVATGILPGVPPTRGALVRWLEEAGFALAEPPSGAGAVGLVATRRPGSARAPTPRRAPAGGTTGR
jgi:ubiquinone/menaquinone biosynthesis C-methylase UbiE